ncbi:hypothetical protein [Paraglaciecola sp. 25GB23A]|uniref:hypothetical protein n=1 Tax=Paraglaciecola sp. 25GB23A TaxID=3156068 RepID=UPI0032AF65F0
MNHQKYVYFSFVGLFLLFCPVQATEQRIGDFEIAIDAPWRMEPNRKNPVFCNENCQETPLYEYGSIPINIAILDAFLPDGKVNNSVLMHKALQGYERNDFTLSKLIYEVAKEYLKLAANPGKIITSDDIGILSKYGITKLQKFSSFSVFEEINGDFQKRASYSINDFHEVELTLGFWQWTGPNDAPPARPSRVLCRRWNGDNCLLNSQLSDTSEWHAIAMYQPANKTPGQDVKLKLVLTLEATVNGRAEEINFDQYVNVHLGEAPLPKFDQNWYYGDLHYHSQGTDNDGESGYSYRSLLQAMSAMGLDFALASDHASNSKQIISVSLAPLGPVETTLLRDLSPDRFAANIEMVNGVDGANQEVASYPRIDYSAPLPANNKVQSVYVKRLTVPQLFLGAEVDVIPEIYQRDDLPHINDIFQSCKNLPKIMVALQNGILSSIVDTGKDLLFPTADTEDGVCGSDNLLDPTSDGRLLVRDIQGPHQGDYVTKKFYARQHLLHFPQDQLRTDTFIASNTSKYGGATRRLKEILSTEFIQPNGVLFLAHPESTATGSDVDRLGPDIAPYSEASLRDAFSAEQVLGLQLWNENAHFKTTMQNNSARENPSISEVLNNTAQLNQAVSLRPNKKLKQKGRFIPVSNLDAWQHEKPAKQSFEGISMWDSMLMWGLDPTYTNDIDWLPEGQPRRVFIAGGSDAHGDYNYRREGYFVGMQQVTDTALGSPRNLIFAGPPEGKTINNGEVSGTPVSQIQIVEAFKQGNFIVTDGPIIRLAYDINNNGKIDSQDKSMGSVVNTNNCGFPLLVEWKSTAEFGPVKAIDLNIGSFSDVHQDGWIFQPWRGNKNVVNPSDLRDDPTFTDVKSGKTLTLAHPNSAFGWRGKARTFIYDPSKGYDMVITLSAGEEFAGIRQINIKPKDFAIGKLKTTNICNLPKQTSTPISPKVAHHSSSNKPQSAGNKLITAKAKVIDNNNGPQNSFGEFDVFQPPTALPPIDPACIVNTVDELQSPDRMYIRAKLTGELRGDLPLKAFTNPIWFNFKNDGLSQCTVATDDFKQEVKNTCDQHEKQTCSTKGARCEVLKSLNGEYEPVCRWSADTSNTECEKSGGIWTIPTSRYAKNHVGAILNGQNSACLTEVRNLTCSVTDINICKNFSATCNVIQNISGETHNVCHWQNDQSAILCKKTLGIWTTLSSQYAKNNPNAITPGQSGACITDVKNLKDRIR